MYRLAATATTALTAVRARIANEDPERGEVVSTAVKVAIFVAIALALGAALWARAQPAIDEINP